MHGNKANFRNLFKFIFFFFFFLFFPFLGMHQWRKSIRSGEHQNSEEQEVHLCRLIKNSSSYTEYNHPVNTEAKESKKEVHSLLDIPQLQKHLC